MKNQLASQRRFKFLTLLGFFCLLIPLSIYIWWIYIFDFGETQAERVDIFNSYFPDFLSHRWDTTILSIIFCVFAIILSAKSLQLEFTFWKVLNYMILTISSILLFLNLFSMM
jgi:hypothetical protein